MFYKGLYYVLILDKVDNFILVYLVIDEVWWRLIIFWFIENK